MVTKETLLKDLYKGTALEKYAKIFYYDFDDPCWQDNALGHFCEGLWANDETVKALNNFEALFNKGLVVDIPLRKENKLIGLTLVKQPKISKLAIVIAGGGYGSVATAVEGLPIGDYLYSKGFAVAYLTYSIEKEARNDNSYKDLVNAIKYLYKNQKELNIDMDNYIIGGCSAGAHLSARLGTSNCGYKVMNLPKPGLIFLAYPVIDFGKYGHKGSVECVLGDNPTQEEIDKVSIQKNVDNSYPPTFLWQCERDNNVPFENALLMKKALEDANVPFIFKSYDSDAHGWSIANGRLAEGWVDEMLNFYQKVVK